MTEKVESVADVRPLVVTASDTPKSIIIPGSYSSPPNAIKVVYREGDSYVG